MLPALDGVRRDTDQPQQAGGGGAHPVAQRLLVALHGRRRRRQRLEDAHRQSRVGTRSVDGEVGRGLQPGDAGSVLAPVGQPLLPGLGLLLGEVLRRKAFLGCLLRVHPGQEVLRLEVGEGQHKVAEVPFGVDHNGGDAVERRLFQQRDAQSGLAAARHTHADAVSDQVLGVVQKEAGILLFGQVVFAAEVERPQLFEVFHEEAPCLARVPVRCRNQS